MPLENEKKTVTKGIRVKNVHDAQETYTTTVAPTTRWGRVKHKFTTKDGWVGNYDYRALW